MNGVLKYSWKSSTVTKKDSGQCPWLKAAPLIPLTWVGGGKWYRFYYSYSFKTEAPLFQLKLKAVSKHQQLIWRFWTDSSWFSYELLFPFLWYHFNRASYQKLLIHTYSFCPFPSHHSAIISLPFSLFHPISIISSFPRVWKMDDNAVLKIYKNRVHLAQSFKDYRQMDIEALCLCTVRNALLDCGYCWIPYNGNGKKKKNFL